MPSHIHWDLLEPWYLLNVHTHLENHKDKHNSKAKYGWYRYDTRFAVPKYDNDGELAGYNIFKGRLVIRHAQDGKLYLYDILRIKKETSEPLE